MTADTAEQNDGPYFNKCCLNFALGEIIKTVGALISSAALMTEMETWNSIWLVPAFRTWRSYRSTGILYRSENLDRAGSA